MTSTGGKNVIDPQLTEVDLIEVLDDLAQYLNDELAKTPTVVEKDTDEFSIEGLETEKREWHRVSDVVALVSDLKSSTSLGLNKWMSSTAAIMEAASGGTVRILDAFNADYWQVQGDGVLAVFWGKKRVERSTCAAIMIQTYGAQLASKVSAKSPEAPPTGIKIGMHSGTVLVKNVGKQPQGSAGLGADPVWIGSPVNYAAKCAQQAEAGRLIVTKTMWDRLSGNDYIAYSCDCKTPSTSIWQAATIDKVRESEQDGQTLISNWCSVHGPDFCDQVLAGSRNRESVRPLRSMANMRIFEQAQRQRQDDARNIRKGLR